MSRVLVTGGGSGIGRAIAQDFAAAGHDVVIAGRTLANLEETAQGRTITCRAVDVTDEAAIDALFDAPFDIVVANAGSGDAMKIKDMPLEVWNSTLAVNLTGVFLTFRAAVRGMNASGRLIAIASTAGLQGTANAAAYAAAKHGVIGLVRSLALEVARDGITCNAVCPGFVDTDMGQAAVTNVMEWMDISRDKAERMVTGGNPIRRMISTDEVVAAVRFLASPEASMVNGHALSVSGGEV
ncbi:SDR family oxidoreductase [Sulfitobacter sp.]|nr:SDR family oxidoreductase [Sulfitobacter sp.]